MFAAGLLGMVLTTTAAAQDVVGDAARGKGKAQMCIGCHGIVGYKANFPEVYHVPRISGQSAKYIETVLDQYRKGTRKHPSMRGIAGSMTDQDIADVAAFYATSAKPEAPKAAPQPSPEVAALLQKGACVSCHGANFNTPIDGNTPKIAGQYADYLYIALKSYRDNTHQTWGRGNAVMGGMAKQYTEAELKAMAKYLSRLPGEVQTVPEPRFR